jgi:hypothetical protein
LMIAVALVLIRLPEKPEQPAPLAS